MGRKIKYKTKEEKRKANCEKYMRFYWRNAKKIRKQKLKEYYEKKNIRNLQNN